MKLLRVGDFVINPAVIAFVELAPLDLGHGQGASDRVHVHLLQSGQLGLGVSPSCLLLSGEDARVIRSFFADPHNQMVFRPSENEGREGDGEVQDTDDVPF